MFKPFYIGATTRQPLERFNLRTPRPHCVVYDGMVVGWVGNATDAKRIERLVIQMAHQCFPYHCANAKDSGREGISEERAYASVYMYYGGRSQFLMRSF